MFMAVSQQMKRLQVLIRSDSYDILQQLAADTNQSVSALVREKIEKEIVEEARIKRRMEAVARLCDGDTPVDDWDVMEREIEKRWEECWPDEWKK
jgi:predicted DNA-binding protein